MSIAVGNAGEHLVMAELLIQGFDAYWADRGNADHDIACFWGYGANRRSTRLRVKTTKSGTAVWTQKTKHNCVFPNIDGDDDYVVIVNLKEGIPGRKIYIAPTQMVEDRLQSDHAFYVKHPKLDGSPRKSEQGMRNFHFHGSDRATDIGYGYDVKFADYAENWDMLK